MRNQEARVNRGLVRATQTELGIWPAGSTVAASQAAVWLLTLISVCLRRRLSACQLSY